VGSLGQAGRAEWLDGYRAVVVEILLDVWPERLQPGIGGTHQPERVADEIAVGVGDPQRELIDAGVPPCHLVAACGRLCGDRRPRSEEPRVGKRSRLRALGPADRNDGTQERV